MAEAEKLPWWGFSRRIEAWWLARLPATDTWALSQRNIYILPTRAGLVFAGLMVLMLVGSINYQLNLGYALTFLLAGAGLVSMHITHNVLRGLTLHMRPAAAVFAGEPLMLEVVMTNPGRQTRHGVGLRYHERRSGRAERRNPQPQPSQAAKPARGQDRRRGPADVWCDVPALGQASTRLSLSPPRRGWHPVPMLVVETKFPFGLFRAWSVWRPAARVLAYPAPERPAASLPVAQASTGEQATRSRSEGSELEGVRAWRRGDTLRQVVWKKVARTGELVSRETTAAGSHELWLDWHAANCGELEQRLSRLSAWVVAAEQMHTVYGLRLPGRQWAAGQGDAHRRQLLEALALWR